jgi:hypothetical protein
MLVPKPKSAFQSPVVQIGGLPAPAGAVVTVMAQISLIDGAVGLEDFDERG